jgi:hypothetical protein
MAGLDVIIRSSARASLKLGTSHWVRYGDPLITAKRLIGRLHDAHRRNGILSRDQKLLFSAYGPREVLNLASEGLNFTVAVAEWHPFPMSEIEMGGFLPTD